jgi:cytoskeletal protein CcmA (bactofilin family)
MAVFNKSNEQSKTTNSTTIISQGTKISGDFNLSAKLHIEGEIEGNINSTNLVSIGKSGIIKGELKADKLLINGKFIGKVEANVVEITNGGILEGDIIIKDLIIEQGGIFEGTSKLKQKVKNETTNRNK